MTPDPHLEFAVRLVQHCREHCCHYEHQQELVGLIDELEIIERVTGKPFEQVLEIEATDA